jgi:hypothetical protein
VHNEEPVSLPLVGDEVDKAMASFNHCPNCHAVPSGGIFGGSWFKIFKCRKCGGKYCYKCLVNEKYCPDCGGESFDHIGEVYAR